jgi:hypothetical protein
MSKFSQNNSNSFRKIIIDHNKLDNFIQDSLNKFTLSKSHPELIKNISSLSDLIFTSKSSLPDLVIFNRHFNKNNCFYSTKKINYYNSFPRKKFVVDYSIKSKISNKEKIYLMKSSEKKLNENNNFKSMNKEKKRNYQISSLSKSFKEKPYNFNSESNNLKVEEKKKKEITDFSLNLNNNEENNKTKNNLINLPSKNNIIEEIKTNEKNDKEEEKKYKLSPDQISEIKKEIQFAQYQNLFLLQQQYYLQYLQMQNLYNDILNHKINNDTKEIFKKTFYNNYNNNVNNVNNDNNDNNLIKENNNKEINENYLNDPLMNDFNIDYKLYNPNIFLENPVLLVKKNLIERNWILMKDNKIIINYNSDELLIFLNSKFKLGDNLNDYCIHDYQTDVVFQPKMLYEILFEYVPKLKFYFWKNVLEKNNENKNNEIKKESESNVQNEV